jgi:uncharacterized protein YbcV (DUF1398 family)
MYKMPITQKLNEDLVFILERQESVLESRKTDSNDYILEGTAAVFGKENNNNRIYEEAEYLPHLSYLNDKISQKRLVGELDHPKEFDISLKNISHIIEALTYDKDNRTIKIKVRLLDTPCGKIAKELVDGGVPLSISSRAAGSVSDNKKVMIKKIFTYDLVADPGFQDAQLERVYESAGYSFEEFYKFRGDSITNDLFCMNESLGLKNESSMKIYRVENNEEFNKLVTTQTDKNKSILMENNDYVKADELNNYSIFLKKEMDSMKSAIEEIKESKNSLTESGATEDTSDLEERVAKLEKYSEYLAENLDNAIKYGEYLAENLDQSISYSKYLAENLDKNISYSKYLAENVDKGISYSEYVAETVDKNIEYSKYLAEKLDQNIQFSDYLAENLDKGISYSEYLGENLEKGIAYTEYVAEKLNDGIEYSEYLAENLNKNIQYGDYLAENVNKGLDYSEYLGEKLKKSISYTEYLAETVNNGIYKSSENLENLRESASASASVGLKESGFAGDYNNISTKIDSLIESVKTQKTETNINEASRKMEQPAKTQKAEQVLIENELNENKTGMKFIDEMPEEYGQVWESLTEGHKQSIVAQSSFYRLDSPYQIKNFWSTRQLGAATVGVQRLVENEQTIAETQTTKAYSSDYMNYIASALDKKFPKR